jgi:hypothetical protein
MGIASFVAGDSEKGITRTRGAKIVFIVAAGCIGAAVWAAGVVVQLHRATGLARLGPDSLVPTEDVWTVLNSTLNLAFLLFSAGLYRDWFTGRRWKRDVFVAMAAACAVDLLIQTAVVRIVKPSWNRGVLDSNTWGALFVGAGVCVSMGLIGIAAASLWSGLRSRGGPARGDLKKTTE